MGILRNRIITFLILNSLVLSTEILEIVNNKITMFNIIILYEICITILINNLENIFI